MKIPVYNLSGEKTKDIDLSNRIFGVEPKTEVIHQVVVAQSANARQILAHTKGKGDGRGGGKKPWRQKGTGRARHGSIRSPLWKGGGVTFGPTKDRNFSKGVNRKQKQLAMAMCLSDKVVDNSFVVFENIESKEGKTKELRDWISEIKSKLSDIKDNKRFLLVIDGKDDNIKKAVRNLDKVEAILADSLNCVDILKADTIFASEKAVNRIDNHYKKINENKVSEKKVSEKKDKK
jgi:large subunit ribosomal protein L4